jgi:protoheme IX farnesyltransferase
MKETFGTYQELAKGGIVTLVLISVFAGYLIGHPAERDFSWWRLLGTLLGILSLASGSSALNQYQEREIDARMPRTANRPLPSGRLSPLQALLFIGITLPLGVAILGVLKFELAVMGLLAVVSYNLLYTLWWKKHYAFAAVPGAIPGALPILMGFAAARVDSNFSSLDPAGLFLFGILFFWQMPHFWVLALKYREDYEAGGIPTLPVKHGTGLTLAQITTWCLAYLGLALLGTFFLRSGALYLSSSFVVSGYVLYELVRFIRAPEGRSWLRFFLAVNFSLILFLLAAVLDLWSVDFLPYLLSTRFPSNPGSP